MSAQRTNNMHFHRTKNPHLIKRNHRSQSQRLTKKIGKSYHKKATSDCFTMIFVDCDDTLIPSKIHRYLFKNFGIDIFNLYQRTMLKQFQYDIIYAIEAIKEIFITHYNEEIRIGIVSNASSKWLDATINNKSDDGYFKLLSDYFNDNEIQITSAIDETFNFLMTKFGKNKEKVNEMMAMSLNADASHKSKWMLKYTAYSSIINKFRRKLKKKCRKIVNIGDGETELEAIKYYAQTFGVDYIALKFIKNATFNQLSYEWKYIKNNFWNIISDMDVDGIYVDNNSNDNNDHKDKQYRSVVIEVGKNRKKQFKHKRNLSNISNATTESHKAFNTFYFDYVLKNDNNAYFTGAHQLTAIATYFEKWMRIYVINQKNKSQRNATLNWMCAKIHSQMRGHDPYTKQMISFKKIIKDALCRNDEFRIAFDKYYNDLRNSLHPQKYKEEAKESISSAQKYKLHRKRSKVHYANNINNNNNNVKIKDSSLSLMNLGKNHRRNSGTSQGTITTNSVNSTPQTTKYYTDDSDNENELNLYFSQHTNHIDIDVDADEENST